MKTKALFTIAFLPVVTLFALAQTKTSPTAEQLITPEQFKATTPVPPIIMAAIVFSVAAVVSGVIFTIVQQRRREQRAAKVRLLWRQKIEQIADDITTAPNGWSLDAVMDCLDEPEWEDICFELEKLPAGKRSLRKAMEITDSDNYERSP